MKADFFVLFFVLRNIYIHVALPIGVVFLHGSPTLSKDVHQCKLHISIAQMHIIHCGAPKCSIQTRIRVCSGHEVRGAERPARHKALLLVILLPSTAFHFEQSTCRVGRQRWGWLRGVHGGSERGRRRRGARFDWARPRHDEGAHGRWWSRALNGDEDLSRHRVQRGRVDERPARGAPDERLRSG